MDRLQALLGDDDVRWLVDRCAQRLARGRPLTGVVTRTGASAAERHAVAHLLGRPPGRGASLSVSLDDVADALRRAGVADDLAVAVEALRGPVTQRRTARDTREAAWERLVDDTRAWAAGDRTRTAWVDGLAADGLLRRLAGGDPDTGRHLLHGARSVIERLPAAGTSRSVLAADALGDGHDLDDGRPVATLVLRHAALLTGRDERAGARGRRPLWASVGVTVDPLTSRVVALGLPGDARTATGRALAALAEAGEPALLTLRQLVGDPPALPVAGGPVFVCENISVIVAAADRLDATTAPLVCLDGHPSTAAVTLLDLLTAAGARLRARADFDWAGLRIAGGVLTRPRAVPWRFGAADYASAVDRSRKPLAGVPTTAPWDPALPARMRDIGIAVEEELLIDTLLTDLIT